jgi:hypothetical protein
LWRESGFAALDAAMKAEWRLRNLDVARRDNSVSIYESHTTTSGKGAASVAATTATKDEDAEDIFREIDDAVADGVGAGAGGGKFVLREDDRKFMQALHEVTKIHKKRLAHQFTIREDPELAKSCEIDWLVPLEKSDDGAIIPLALNDDEQALFERAVVLLREKHKQEIAAKFAGKCTAAAAKALQKAVAVGGILPDGIKIDDLGAAAAAGDDDDDDDEEAQQDNEGATTKTTQKKPKKASGKTIHRSMLVAQSNRDTKPFGAQLTTTVDAGGGSSMRLPSEHLDMIVATEAVNVHRVLTYGEICDIEERLIKGEATSADRLAIINAFAHMDTYCMKVILAERESSLLGSKSSSDPNDLMKFGRLLAKRDTGFTRWLASCYQMTWLLQDLLRLVNMNAGACQQHVKPHKRTLPNDWSPVVPWDKCIRPPSRSSLAEVKRLNMARILEQRQREATEKNRK